MTAERNGARTHGRIARIVIDKETGLPRGFGFIAETAGNKQYFFHATDLVRGGSYFGSIREGQRVTFEPSSTEKGLRAAHVEIINE